MSNDPHRLTDKPTMVKRVLLNKLGMDFDENLINCVWCHCQALLKISSKSAYNFLSYVANRQTDRQTDEPMPVKKVLLKPVPVKGSNQPYLDGGLPSLSAFLVLWVHRTVSHCAVPDTNVLELVEAVQEPISTSLSHLSRPVFCMSSDCAMVW